MITAPVFQRKLLPLLPVILVLVWGCKEPHDTPPEDALLSIDLTVFYDHDSVLVELDEETFFTGTVTTDYIWSLAWKKATIVPAGMHHVQVLIYADSTQGDTAFTVQDTVTLDVRYRRDWRRIWFRVFDSLLMYD